LKEKLKEYIDLLKKCPHLNEEMLFLASLHARGKERRIQRIKMLSSLRKKLVLRNELNV
jgi:hypothetical protein